jgi:tRNA pseudouridine38-40 synthase
MRYFLRISFDGSDFHGWQVQQNAHTVQAELNTALGILLRNKNIETIGCGRTDTGVHARKFFIHFDANEISDTDDFIHHLNSLLPNTIAVHSLFPVADDAHARFGATSRTYKYRIYQDKNPFLRMSAYYFSPSIDIPKMNKLADSLKKHQDFSSFSKSRTQTKTNNCKITFAEWKQEGDEIVFTITADRFLRNMVRAIVGTLLNGGINKMNADEFLNIMLSRNRSNAGVSVPAHGLYLEEITYPFPVY